MQSEIVLEKGNNQYAKNRGSVLVVVKNPFVSLDFPVLRRHNRDYEICLKVIKPILSGMTGGCG